MSVFAIDQPQLWDLPADSKQKVVWLCARCSLLLDVRADHHRHVIQLIHKARRGMAA